MRQAADSGRLAHVCFGATGMCACLPSHQPRRAV